MLRLEGLSVHAGPRTLIAGLSLELEPGRLTCLIGPSGCGKTTVLRWLAGILPPELDAQGRLTLAGGPGPGQDLARPNPAIGYQPQQDALFPWLSIARNAALGLEVAGVPRREALARVRPLFAPFGLSGCEELFPSQLSGGMRQRAAFLRTMARESRFLLLDEPFSALDAVTRLRMQGWLCQRLAEAPRGVLLITHDLHEASQLADRILVMAGPPGRIIADIAVPGRPGARAEAELAGLRSHLKSLLLED